MTSRRRVVIALGSGALAAALEFMAQAQPHKVWRIGFLREIDRPDYVARFDAFKTGMRDLGYVEGRDYDIEIRSARANPGLLPELAAELVAAKIELILVGGTPAALAASKATQDIPILMATVGDPVFAGLAGSLAHPGRNVTGLTSMSTELVTKRLDLLHQILPHMRRAGLLYDPTNLNDAPSVPRFNADCMMLGVQPILAAADSAEGIATAFETLGRDGAEGLVVATGNTNTAALEQIVRHAAEHRLPSIYGLSAYPEAGGLASYAADYSDLFRRAAAYADKIFKGAKPADLAIEQPVKFDLVISIKAARAIGIEFPQSILVQATKVVE
jgi:putative ABC transport system substrate-binding protein